MRTIIIGKCYEITKQQIEAKMETIQPESGKIYFVEIEGKDYPIKQVISETLNIPRVGFTTMYAYHILGKLDFKITCKRLKK